MYNVNREENNSKKLSRYDYVSFQKEQCHQIPCKMNKIYDKAQHRKILVHQNNKKNLKIEEITCF